VYKISYSKEAQKSLLRMPRNTANSIREKLQVIAISPYADHPNTKKLQGREVFRLRVEDWRVIYKIQSVHWSCLSCFNQILREQLL